MATAGLRRLRRPLAAAFSSAAAAGSGRPEQLTIRRQERGVRNIILNNPRKRNALSLSMLRSLREDLLHDAKSKELRVIVISDGLFLKCFAAEGPVFCSGHDLKELSSEDDVKHHSQVFEMCAEVALEMLFTGEPLSAHEALMHGLVSKVVPEDKLEEETMKISQKICASSKSVLALGKATFYRQMTQDLDTAYKITTQVMVDNLTLRDGQEGNHRDWERAQIIPFSTCPFSIG
ncbi:Echdc3 [Columba guinea]|nr:Echdc3 [Columba guinea]